MKLISNSRAVLLSGVAVLFASFLSPFAVAESPFRIKGFDPSLTRETFIQYVEEHDLKGPPEFDSDGVSVTYHFDDSESAKVPTVGGVRVDRARWYEDNNGDINIFLGFYDRGSEQLAEADLCGSPTKKTRILIDVMKKNFGPAKREGYASVNDWRLYAAEIQWPHLLSVTRHEHSMYLCKTTINLETRYRPSTDADYDDI